MTVFYDPVGDTQCAVKVGAKFVLGFGADKVHRKTRRDRVL